MGDNRYVLRIPDPEDRKLWEQAAELEERGLADWMRFALRKVAKETIKKGKGASRR